MLLLEIVIATNNFELLLTLLEIAITNNASLIEPKLQLPEIAVTNSHSLIEPLQPADDAFISRCAPGRASTVLAV